MSLPFSLKMGFALACFSSSLALATGLEFHKERVRAMPPSSPNSAAYMIVHNHSNSDEVLIGVESDAAKAVELHTHVMEDGTMKMRQVHAIPVPAWDQVEFKPGGYHIMLMGLTQPLNVGDVVNFTLITKNGEKLPMQAPVVAPEEINAMPEKAAKHSHGEHKHH